MDKMGTVELWIIELYKQRMMRMKVQDIDNKKSTYAG